VSDPRTWPRPSECQCLECRSYCSNRPGWFAPGEVEVAAEHLGIEPDRLFRTRLVVDWVLVDGRPVFGLSPTTVLLVGRQVWPPGRACGTCTFLRPDGGCGIHRVKPLECALAHHAQTDDAQRSAHDAIVALWDTPAGREEVRRLLGREPEIENDVADVRLPTIIERKEP
jgi:hypothetical protein